jgi:threonine-phosphate decarboxylase
MAENFIPQDHGGDLYSTGEGPVLCDFSASINPLGYPDGLTRALEEHWGEVLHYPDRHCRALVAAIRKRYGLSGGEILCGNGSAELLDLVIRSLAVKRLLLCPPDFGLYERCAPESVEIVRIPRDEETGFGINPEKLLKAVRPGDLVLFSNPGNPSGAVLAREEVLALARGINRAGAVLAVDEAFADFCPRCSVLDLPCDESGLVVLRSLTKFYAIPGIRAGFLSAGCELFKRISALQLPWSVSVPAQVLATHCLSDDNWAARSRDYLLRSREKLVAGLKSIPGITPLPSEVNYLLVRLDPPAPNADELFRKLRKEGTLVRHCGSFGLGSRYIRVAVRTVGENADLVRHLQKITGAAGKAP